LSLQLYKTVLYTFSRVFQYRKTWILKFFGAVEHIFTNTSTSVKYLCTPEATI